MGHFKRWAIKKDQILNIILIYNIIPTFLGTKNFEMQLLKVGLKFLLGHMVTEVKRHE